MIVIRAQCKAEFDRKLLEEKMRLAKGKNVIEVTIRKELVLEDILSESLLLFAAQTATFHYTPLSVPYPEGELFGQLAGSCFKNCPAEHVQRLCLVYRAAHEFNAAALLAALRGLRKDLQRGTGSGSCGWDGGNGIAIFDNALFVKDDERYNSYLGLLYLLQDG